MYANKYIYTIHKENLILILSNLKLFENVKTILQAGKPVTKYVLQIKIKYKHEFPFFLHEHTDTCINKKTKKTTTKKHSHVMFTEHWFQSFKGKVCINKLAKKQNQLKLKWR